jgi:hypothetical protein
LALPPGSTCIDVTVPSCDAVMTICRRVSASASSCSSAATARSVSAIWPA